MEPTQRFRPADFSTEELMAVNEDLAAVVEEYAERNRPLAQLAHGLMLDIVEELFTRVAGDKPENRETLRKLWRQIMKN